jgi:hypothetical protein
MLSLLELLLSFIVPPFTPILLESVTKWTHCIKNLTFACSNFTVWIIHLKQEVPVRASANKGLTITATIEEESRCARAYPQSAPTHKRNFVHNLLPVMEQDG